MLTKVPMRCCCGSVEGTAMVSAETGNRVVCMCDDCQTFAHFLGRADEILDAHGGTEIFQLAPARLKIVRGAEHLRCMRLSPKGLMRWYTDCCKTPLGNTLSTPKMPFVGVPMLFFDPQQTDLEQHGPLGPVRAKLMGKYARGGMPADAHPTHPAGLMLRTTRLLLVAFLRRQYAPSPFFASDGKPIVEPLVLSQQDRQSLRQKSNA